MRTAPSRAALTAVLLTALITLPGRAEAGQLDVHLSRVATHGNAQSARALSRTGFVTLHTQVVAGKHVLMTSAFIQARPTAIAALRALGVKVRSVLSQGIITADIPVSQLRAVAALSGVGRVEAAKRVQKRNDISNSLVDPGTGVTWGMNNSRAFDGKGVIVGVIDSGLDWTHGDFIDDASGQSRILYYWDQSDTADDKLPAGPGWSFSYGHEYTKADFNAALAGWDHTWNQATNAWTPVEDPSYPIKAAARDTDGHGTHVTGTAAGDGSASGLKGAASGADIVFVKFDFDGARNTDTAIVEGIDYIFKRAAEAGKPAVINMSLGSDYGPHDGSTLEEQGIDGLTGPGKVVVVAAGNPGSSNWSNRLAWGFALHGSGTMGTDPITFRFPVYTAGTESYVFFDAWYGGSDSCRVQITSPSGAKYPPNFSGKNKNTWVTGKPYSGFNTPEGGILVGNGGDQLSWSTNNGDHELYVEISDYWGVDPAPGVWTIEIIPLSTPEGGKYQAWYGVSSDVVHGWQAEPLPRSPTPRFGGRESDNAMTIGSPASANKVIAVAAYQSRNQWDYVYGTGTQCSTNSAVQAYGVAPVDYYDPFGLGELANFSGRGPRRDGVLKPEIATPGVGIASSLSHFVRHQEWTNPCQDYFQGGYYHFGTNRVLPGLEGTVIQGTSMACPNATGAIAVMMQVDPALDDAGLRSLFWATARHDDATDLYQFSPHTPYTDTDAAAAPGQSNADWGFGKLDLNSAIAWLGPCLVDSDCDDGNACTTDTCNAGACANAALPEGTSCGGQGICCGTSCNVPACGSDADCGDPEACTSDVCANAGTCAAVCQNNWPVCGVSDGCCGPGCSAPGDGDCAVCAAKGASCGSNADCCSNKCGGKPGSKICK